MFHKHTSERNQIKSTCFGGALLLSQYIILYFLYWRKKKKMRPRKKCKGENLVPCSYMVLKVPEHRVGWGWLDPQWHQCDMGGVPVLTGATMHWGASGLLVTMNTVVETQTAASFSRKLLWIPESHDQRISSPGRVLGRIKGLWLPWRMDANHSVGCSYQGTACCLHCLPPLKQAVGQGK